MSVSSGSQTFSMMQMDRDMQMDLDDSRRAGPSSLREAPNDRHVVSRRNKAVAAIGGAAVTSLLMTPFDVIKTRLQIQHTPEPLFQPSPSSTPGATCCQSTQIIQKPGLACQHDPRMEVKSTYTAARSSIAHSSSHYSATETLTAGRAKMIRMPPSMSPGISAIACDFPDREVAVRELEKTRSNGRMVGLWDGVIKVSRAEGARGLWRGLTPTLFMTVPSQLTYMTCYDAFRQYFLSLDQNPLVTTNQPSFSNISSHTLMASLASGALSRSISATLVTPLELIRTRLQASGSHNGSRSLTSFFGELAHQVKNEGPTVMFRGLVPTLYRDVPFSAIYFAGYETMKRVITGSGLGERNAEDGRAKEFSVAFVSGSTSGILAAIVTQPFDLIKTRLQAEEQKKGRRANTKQVFREILAKEGTSGLFRGLSPRVAKVAPACGIMIASFEFVGRWLQENC